MGEDEDLAQFLAKTFDVFYNKKLYQSVLDWAAKNGSSKIVALLVTTKPALARAAIEDGGWTALHEAASHDYHEIVALLLTNAAGSCDSKTAVNDALGSGSQEEVVARMLLEDTSLIEKVYTYGETALHCAARLGYDEGVARLLVESPEMINAVDRMGGTALHEAARSGSQSIVTQLLAAGPGLINATDYQSSTVLHTAALYGHPTIVAQLLAASPPLIDKVDLYGRSALHRAIASNRESAAKILLATKPDLIHSTDNKGNTALHLAATHRRLCPRFLEHLLSLNPEALHAVNRSGNTPFHSAVQEANDPAVDVLQVKLSLDSVVHVFHSFNKESLVQERLVPIVEKQCECATPMSPDALSVVYAYLGFDRREGPQHKKLKTQ